MNKRKAKILIKNNNKKDYSKRGASIGVLYLITFIVFILFYWLLW